MYSSLILRERRNMEQEKCLGWSCKIMEIVFKYTKWRGQIKALQIDVCGFPIFTYEWVSRAMMSFSSFLNFLKLSVTPAWLNLLSPISLPHLYLPCLVIFILEQNNLSLSLSCWAMYAIKNSLFLLHTLSISATWFLNKLTLMLFQNITNETIFTPFRHL